MRIVPKGGLFKKKVQNHLLFGKELITSLAVSKLRICAVPCCP